MANQKVKIDIGTTYNGRGVVQANSGFGKLNNTIIQTSKNSQKMLGAVGALGGAFGQSAGAAGKFAGAVGGVAQALAGGWLGIAVGGIGLMVSLWQSAKQRAEEYRKEIENQKKKLAELDEQRAKAVSDRFAKEKEAEHKALGWLKDRLNAVKALVGAYKELNKAQAEGGRTRNEGRANRIGYDAQRAADAEKNEAKKNLILKQGEAKKTEYQGRVDVKYAEKDVADARKEAIDLQNELVKKLSELTNKKALQSTNDKKLAHIKANSDIYGGKEYKAYVDGVKGKGDALKDEIAKLEEEIKLLNVGIKTATTKEQTARDKLSNVRETAEFNNYQANKEVEEAKKGVEADKYAQKAKGEEQARLRDEKEQLEYNKKMVEEEKASREKILEKLDSEIATLRTRLDKINETQKEVERGVTVNNNTSGSGLNGGNRYGQYDYSKNDNGKGGMNAAGIARGRRMAEGGKRDQKAKEEGKNVQERRRQRMADLDKEFQRELDRAGGDEKKAKDRMGKSKSRERDNLHAWDDQNNKENLNKQANDKQQERDNVKDGLDALDTSLQDISQTLDNINSTLSGGLK